ERLAPGAQSLAAQAVEVLGGGAGINHLEIVIRPQHQESLDARARVFGALSFKTVRQQHDKPAKPLPFFLRAGDERVDHRLGDVPKVAELRFPKNESVRVIEAITIFETEHADLGKGAVDDFNRCLVGREVLQGRPGMAVLVIVENRVPLAEGTTLAVLSAE